ncbi:MAG TPA: hypothetical protein VLM87_00430 [Rubrivivax sp.]|nr:hypothetical protein [Rubrivivax sp.]
MAAARRPVTLAQQNLRWLATLFLGLAIVRQLPQTQGWKLELSARPGGGLQASIDVPLAPRAGT